MKRTARLEAPQNQEAVFSIFMGLAALLGAWDSRLQYHAVLWAFGAFLAANLVAHFLLRHSSGLWAVRASIATNALLVTWIIQASGGPESYFWPMLLLPLFTAGLHLKPRELRLWATAVLALLAWSYRTPLISEYWTHAAEWAVKASGLALAAAVAGRMSARERVQRLRVVRSRRKLERMAADACRGGSASMESLGGLLHDLGNPITVVMGSSGLLLGELPAESPFRQDVQRIYEGSLRCRDLLQQIREWFGPGGPGAPGVATGQLVGEMLRLFEHQVQRRHLSVHRTLAQNLPSLGAGSLPLQQALLSLVHQMVERTDDGARLDVTAGPSEHGVALRLVSERLRPAQSADRLKSCGDLLRRHGGSLTTRNVSGGLECDVYLPVAGS